MAFSILGISLVALLLWWYFTDEERWDPATHGMSYLGSTSEDSTTGAPARTSADSQATQTSIPISASNAVKAGGQAQLVEHPVRVEIWNGCGKKGLAVKAMSALRARSSYFDVRGTGNAGKTMYDFSTVVGRTYDSTLALTVADSLGITRTHVTMDIPRSPRDIDVTIILGADYSHLKLGLTADSKE